MSWFILCFAMLSAPPAADRPTVIVVVGAEGTAAYKREFETWAGRWDAAARGGNANVVNIGWDKSAPSPGGEADKGRLRAAIASEVKAAGTQALWIVLIGHGTHDGKEAKFNLRGPDVSDAEIAEWLTLCRRPLAVINCASSSAPFLNRLSDKGRVVITATRSGNEQNFARFGDHLSAAIGDAGADLDKDGQTSLLEAFIAASHRVEEFYKQDARLATEHALLDDNGNALGIPGDWFQGTRATRAAKDGAPLDGPAAHRWHLLLSKEEQAMGAAARARRDEIEAEIEALRATKATLAEQEYYTQLDELMIRLARVYADTPEAAKPADPKLPAAAGTAGPSATPAR